MKQKRTIQALQMARDPSSLPPSVGPAQAPSPARVTLPGDLSGSLKYLDGAQLQRLLDAVTVEIDRRNGSTNKETAMAATGTPPRGPSAASRNEKIGEIDELPEGRANLIWASFKAGVKPAAIARTFRISQSLEPALAYQLVAEATGTSHELVEQRMAAHAGAEPQLLLRDAVAAAAQSLRFTLATAPIHDFAEAERAVEAFAREPDGDLMVCSNIIMGVPPGRGPTLAARYRLPAVYSYPIYAKRAA